MKEKISLICLMCLLGFVTIGNAAVTQSFEDGQFITSGSDPTWLSWTNQISTNGWYKTANSSYVGLSTTAPYPTDGDRFLRIYDTATTPGYVAHTIPDNDPSLETSAVQSISFDYYVTKYAADRYGKMYFKAGDYDDVAQIETRDLGNGYMYIYYNPGTATGWGSRTWAATITTNAWHHYEFVFDYNNDTCDLIVDGAATDMTDNPFAYLVDIDGADVTTNGEPLRQYFYSYSGVGSRGSLHYMDNFVYTSVPEPATMLMLGLGGLLIRRKRA